MPQDAPPLDRGGAETPSAAGGNGPASRKVLIVEDHPLFAEALELTLKSRFGLRDARRVGSLTAALAAVAERDEAPDTILFDLGLPDATGVEGLARLRAAAPLARILVVTSLTDPRLAGAALASGADGVLTKDAPRERIGEALRAVWAGERVIPASVAAPDGAEGEAAEAARKLAALTPQQARILDLVCAGMLNKQIAYELDIAETTVKAHISAILRKLGVQSRTQAVLAARKARFDSIAPGAVTAGASAEALSPVGGG